VFGGSSGAFGFFTNSQADSKLKKRRTAAVAVTQRIHSVTKWDVLLMFLNVHAFDI